MWYTAYKTWLYRKNDRLRISIKYTTKRFCLVTYAKKIITSFLSNSYMNLEYSNWLNIRENYILKKFLKGNK